MNNMPIRKTTQIYCVLKYNTQSIHKFPTTYTKMYEVFKARGTKDDYNTVAHVASNEVEEDFLYAIADNTQNVDLNKLVLEYKKNIWAGFTTDDFQVCFAPTRKLADDGFNKLFIRGPK